MSKSLTPSILVVCALTCEARPLVAALDLKPLRENQLGERFQVFHNSGVYAAVSGVGKVRSAIATAALGSGLFPNTPAPIIVNIGIAGTSATDLAPGTLVYVNKVSDVATHARFYPDILLKHGLVELPLETHDQPVTTVSPDRVLVDMEGSGFLQAASTIVPPSKIGLLKVISDHCSSERVTPDTAAGYIERNIADISRILYAMRDELPEMPQMSVEERELFTAVTAHATFSLTQRIELERRLTALKALNGHFADDLRAVLATPVSTKERRNAVYHKLLEKLEEAVLL